MIDRTEKGELTSVCGALLTIFAGIIYEDLRNDPCTCSQFLKMSFSWLTVLGMTVLIAGIGQMKWFHCEASANDLPPTPNQ